MPTKQTVFKNAHWLTFEKGLEANLTRTTFYAENTVKATVKIIALGFFEAYINGKRVSNDKFVPAMSNYEARDLSQTHMPMFDVMHSRIYYNEYDITPFTENGKNVLGVHIGAGWYGQDQSKNEGMPKWGENTLIFSITLQDKNGGVTEILSSAENTKWHKSWIKETSIYFGEYHDCHLYKEGWCETDFDDGEWQKPTVRTAPDAEICKTDFPADKIIRTIKPVCISTFGDRKIYDIGELAAGYAVIKFDSRACENDTACVRYADELHNDGSLDFYYCGGDQRMQKDYFLVTDHTADMEFYPHFTWHAARYIEITGRAEFLRYEVVQSDIKQLSFFESSNETLNWIFNAYVKTQQANIHGCVPSDCPHRERLGYTGDGQLTAGAVMSVFDARELYTKWMRDVRDCQDMTTGHVQYTSPFYGGGGGPGGWGGASCIVPYRYYEFYGDMEMLKISFDSMKAYIRYMQNHSEDGIVTHAEKVGWCLGDWCPPKNNIIIPPAYVNTYFLVKTAQYVSKTALVLGYGDEIDYYNSVAEDAKKALIHHFFDPETGSFCGGVQGADAFAADIELGGEKIVENLVKKYSELKTFDTGIFGTDILIRVLFRHGYASLAYSLLINEQDTSYYNMKKHGATTLWEHWDGCESRCHPMFGAINEYFFSEILGIKRYMDKPTYSEVTVTPAYLPELEKVNGTLGTPYGSISVSVCYDADNKQCVTIKTTGEIKVIENN